MASQQQQATGHAGRTLTINQQVFAALFFVNFMAVVLFTAAGYFSRRKALIAEIDDRLFSVATMARATLPADYHDRITGPESVTSVEFDKLVEHNNRLCVELGLEYIWSLMVVDGRIVFTTSTSPDKVADNRKHAAFFEPHLNPELYTNTFATMQTTYTCNRDKWGYIRAVLVPAVDRQGRAYLFGASVRMAEVDRKLMTIFWRGLALGTVLFALSVCVGFWVSRVVTNPLRRLAEIVELIAGGKTHLVVEERGTVEYTTLARHLNAMNRALRGKIVEVETERRRLIVQHDDAIKQAEDKRLMSEQRYRGLLNFAVDGILIGSPEGVISEANVCMCGFFGLSRAEIIGKQIGDMPFTAESVRKKPFQFSLLQKGETVVSERVIRRRDGSEVVVEMHTKMMPDGTYQSIYHDITERKLAEAEIKRGQEQLARQYEMLDALMQNLTVGVFMVEAPSGKPLVANQAARELLGRGVLPNADAGTLGEVYEAYRLSDRSTRYPVSAMPITLGMQGISAHVDDLVVVRPDGTERTLEIFGSPVKDAHGHVWASLVSFSDITERKLIELALRDSEDRYRQLFEMESDAILLIDNETGRILDANVAAQSMYGYTREELLSMKNVDISAEPDQTKRVTKSGVGEVESLVKVPLRKHRSKEGTAFPVEITGRFFIMNGRDVHIAAIRDITERRKAQELLESWNASLERRVAERTAEAEKYARQLQALTGRLVLVEEEERQRITDVLHEDVQQTLVAARMMLGAALGSVRGAAAQGALNSVDSMLTRSIQLTRSLVQEIAVPSVREGEVPAAIRWLAQQVQEKFGMKVKVTADEDVSAVSINMYLCLYRAVQELLFNVAKHAGVREAEVSICQDIEGRLQVAVSDHGCGFSHDVRLESESGNDGFGLFSIRERIEGLGGRMEVISAVGRGTTIILTVSS